MNRKEIESLKNDLAKTNLMRAELEGANLAEGILTIELENIIPDERKPKQIAIGKKQSSYLRLY